jgi:DNA-binding beta-propeller fold protein YncE
MRKGSAVRLWFAAVAVGLSLAFGAASAQAAPFVYVTGSSEVSQFDIGAAGLLSPLLPPTAPGLSMGIGIVVSPDGKSVYVANNYFPAGTPPKGISQYNVGPDGTLTPKNPPAVPTVASPVAVAISPDGKSVYVVPDGQGIAQFDVGAGGQLSPKNPPIVSVPPSPQGGRYLIAVAVTPDGKSVYVLDWNENEIFQYDVGADGTLSPKDPPSVDSHGLAPFAVAVSPDGHSVYVVDRALQFVGGSGVAQYDVGPNGVLSPKTPATVATGPFLSRGFGSPEGVAVSPDGKSVYVPADTGVVSQYDVRADGTLSPKSPPTVAAGEYPISMALSPDGQSAYVVSGSAIAQYDVGAGGRLSPKNPATVGSAVSSYGIAVSPAPVPIRKEQCKGGGWRDFPQFRNQGSCVSFVQAHP